MNAPTAPTAAMETRRALTPREVEFVFVTQGFPVMVLCAKTSRTVSTPACAPKTRCASIRSDRISANV